MGMTATATRLIKRFGQEAILRKPGPTSGDPWSPTSSAPIDNNVIIAVTQYTADEHNSAAISSSDLRVFMTADVAPSNADGLIIENVSYSIKSINTLGPDGVVICYELQVRR
jgi:hypothetical protein